MDHIIFMIALTQPIQRGGSHSAKDILLDMTGIVRTFIPVISLVCPFALSPHHLFLFSMAIIPTDHDVLVCSTKTLPQPPHTHEHSPPAFRKARLTLIGCTDPFL